MKQKKQHGTMELHSCFLGTCVYAMWKQLLGCEQTVKGFKEAVGGVQGEIQKTTLFFQGSTVSMT